MNTLQKMEAIQVAVDDCLATFFEDKITEAERIEPLLGPIVKSTADFVLVGGKRIRPILVWVGYMLGEGKNPEKVITACAAMECVHAFLLVQDDIMDRDEMRRGRPALHRHYAQNYGNHTGNSLGIIASDLLCGYGYELLWQSAVPGSRRMQAGQILAQTINDVSLGQALDVMYSHADKHPTQDQVLTVAEYKTAKYSLESPLRIGLALAGAPPEGLEFALPLGIAFQLQDDLLGLIGDPTLTGKTKGADIREGKETLALAKARDTLSPAERKQLDQVFGNSKASTQDIEVAINALRSSGAVEAVSRIADDYFDKALAMVTETVLIPYIHSFLVDFITYLRHRDH